MAEEARRVAVWDSPLCYHENSSEKFGFSPKMADSRHCRAAKFMTNVILGPMPVDAFLDKFLQRPNVSLKLMPPAENAFNEVPGTSRSESEIYRPLVVALNTRDRCPGFTFRITASKRDEDQGRRGAIAPDICCYSKEHAELEKVKLTSTVWESRTFMGYTAFFIEVKKDPELDPFRDPPPTDTDRSTWKFVLNYVGTDRTGTEKISSDQVTKEMFRALGQNTTYATEMFARQHRHCCFSATLSGSSARFIRWDRAGAIVSEAFDIRTPSGALHLCQFLWCFAHMGDAGRGYDLTVTTATRIERELFVDAIKQHAKLQMSSLDKSAKDAAAMHCSEDAISVVEVPDSSGDVDAVTEGIRRLLISRPIVYPHFLTGRATRAYWAVEAGTKRVVFLKDTWREDPSPSGQNEGDTILYLTQTNGLPEGVQYPPVVCHADLPMKGFVFKMFPDGMRRSVAKSPEYYQATMTQEFLHAPWVCGRARRDHMAGRVHLKKRIHYRLVLEIAGLPLDRFSSSRELLSCTRDISGVLWYAAHRAGIGHRDITPENIIIYREPDGKRGKDHKPDKPRKVRGYLVDWDLAWPLDRPLLNGGLPFSGTWQFVAHRYRVSPAPDRHKLEYDMESLLYVVIYCALLWLPHNSRPSVEYPMESVFGEGTATVTGGVSGGTGKFSAFQDGGSLSTIVWDCTPLQEWITEMRKTLTQDVRENWVTFPLAKFWKDTLKKTGFPEGDRIAGLPPLNGLRKDGNIRYVGVLYVPTTVPTKRAFDNAMPDFPTSTDAASTAAPTVVPTAARAAASNTVERAVRGQLAKATLASMPVARDATSTTSATPKNGPMASKAPDATHSAIEPTIRQEPTRMGKLQAVDTVAKRRRDRLLSKKGKEKEALSDAD